MEENKMMANPTIQNAENYCPDLFSYQRFKTREVMVGKIGIGGNNPIRVQSMTTTDTMDTEGSVAQSVRMIEAGCELVRITAPSKKDAQNLEVIKSRLREMGYDAPLVADIHFTPNAAEIAARIVEKVRVTPEITPTRRNSRTSSTPMNPIKPNCSEYASVLCRWWLSARSTEQPCELVLTM